MPNYFKVSDDGEIISINDWATPNNRDWHAEAKRTELTCADASRTQQHLAEETDINTIVERFLKTGMTPQVATPPQYGDFSTTEDYHSMQNRLAEVNGLFYKLPAAIRASYHNDPGAWLGDVNEKLANGDLAPLREMGLDVPTATPELPSGGDTPSDPPALEPPKTAP